MKWSALDRDTDLATGLVWTVAAMLATVAALGVVAALAWWGLS